MTNAQIDMLWCGMCLGYIIGWLLLLNFVLN